MKQKSNKNKKILVVILFLFVSYNLYSMTFGTSILLRSPKDESKPIDYRAETYTKIDSILSISVEQERQDGDTYKNVEIFAWQYWKSFQLSGKYISIEEDSLKNISIDVRYKYKSYSAGIAQTWDLHPIPMLVFGKTIRFSTDVNSDSGILNVLLNSVQKVELTSITNFYTADFQNFLNETEIKFKLKVGVRIYIVYTYKSRYYDDYIFSTKLGLEFEF